VAGATRPVAGGAYSGPRSEPGGQNTPRAGRVVVSYGTYTSAFGQFTQQVDQGDVWDDAADATAIVTASGSSVEDYVLADTDSGTATVSGTGTESSTASDSGVVTITASGTGTEVYSLTKTSVARISLTGGTNPTTQTNHKLCFRARKTSGSEPVHLWAALYQGSTNRSGDLVSDDLTTSLATYVLPIPDASAASISSYSDLELRFWGESPQGNTASVEVADAWLELPSPSLTYSAVVLVDGPVAYWRGSIPVPPVIDALVIDQTGRGNNLRLWHNSGAEAAYPKDAPSLIASSADPAMDFIPNSNIWQDQNSLSADFAPATAFSLEAWCKPRAGALSGGVQHDIARKATYYGLTIEYVGGNYVFAALATDGLNSVIRYAYSPSAIVADTTYHVVATFDATNLRLYVDGVLVATQPIVGIFTPGSGVGNFAVSEYSFPVNAYDGIIDEIALYNYALTSTQVQTHHDAGIAVSSDTTAPIPTVTVVDVTKISRVVGKDVVNVTFTTDEAFVEYEIRRVSSGSDSQAAGNQVEAATVSSRTSHSIAITDDELVAAAAVEGSNTLKIFVKDVVGNWST